MRGRRAHERWWSARWRRALTYLSVLVAGVVGALTLAPPASAVVTRMTIGEGLGSCPGGYVCLWTLNNFTGSGYAFYNSESNYAQLPAPFNRIQDLSFSFYSHGNTYDIRFYRDNNSGDSFVLCRGQSIPQLPANSYLPVDVREPGRGWQKAISSHKFGAWC